ncbi:putative FBD-associated F-box protein At3g12840 [Trifolium pratense]|uniref:putative FBD-associated F-box protein At3g12840 n=1 Tax=Trifolium pratense TaxID=57577 RepID=UPI001E690C73|nr:putative FBD-associated F-box protein At3g12840 [Trifolium pratense]
MTSSSRRPIPTIDRISDLPDSILSHILSFLPTKQASATSILSKRWKLVWHSILTLNFDQNKDTFKNCFHFEEFIYFTISSLRENSIRLFTFKCSGDSNFNQRFYNQILCRNFWKHPPTVPECLSSQLKTCCIKRHRHRGIKYLVEFVKYIMQHSEVLETMTIRSSSLEKDRMLRELSSLKRGSKKCKLLFN